jgi:hypothetical protein
MRLQVVVTRAGITLRVVAFSLEIELSGGTVTAEGGLDFIGALAASKDAPAGFTVTGVSFDLDTDVGDEQIQTLLRPIERYRAVCQTLESSTQPSASASRAGRTR